MKTLTAALVWLVCSSAVSADSLRLAVTTSFENSGLADVLLPAIKRELDLNVELLVVGTGQALRLGQAGDVDALLVHAPSAEAAFVASGYGASRREIMYNDFIVLGPKNDPGQISQSHSASQAFVALAKGSAPFVSRGDDSGTHKAERALWENSDLEIEEFGPWYLETGSGMGAALNTASAMGAYVLSDRASWLNFGNQDDLEIVFQGDAALFNQYSFIAVDPTRHDHVKFKLANNLEDWLVGESARELVDSYELNGARLFTHNAKF
ncbi:MAG: substrate-binding domain-containing protein [Paracoccaceae bacterium]|jgi:tungstate transport system substrate-binding protein|nr:substrate-binding domain-containing protein [Paracoccaceae bacterium]